MRFSEQQQLLMTKYRNDMHEPTIFISRNDASVSIDIKSSDGSDTLKIYKGPKRSSNLTHILSEARIFSEEIGCAVKNLIP